LEDTQKVFTSYDIQECLYDEVRVKHFQKAISNTVSDGDIVVDAGSGTGLLGMLAARAGAKKVYCIEIEENYVEIIRENARRNGMQDIIVAMHGDATRCDLPQDVDVITSEVISAGFFYEPQLQILNNLRRFLKPDGATVPIAMTNYIQLIQAQQDLYDLEFSYDTRHHSLKGDTPLTNRREYFGTTFRQHTSPTIEAETRLRCTSAGLANAVRISYSIQFGENTWIEKPTEFLMNPQIIFLKEPIALDRGAEYDVAISYEASSSPMTCQLEVTPVVSGSRPSRPSRFRRTLRAFAHTGT
jgi:predicted RNA methylase